MIVYPFKFFITTELSQSKFNDRQNQINVLQSSLSLILQYLTIPINKKIVINAKNLYITGEMF